MTNYTHQQFVLVKQNILISYNKYVHKKSGIIIWSPFSLAFPHIYISPSFFRSENPKFVEALRQLESSPVCQSLAMHSFLMLPMQRITRLPLLVDAIFNRLNTTSPEYQPCKEALQTFNKVCLEYIDIQHIDKNNIKI